MWLVNIRLKRRGARERLAVVGADEAQARGHGLVAEVRLGEVLGAGQLVEAVAAVALGALDQRVAERADVAGRDPDLGVHQDAGVQAHDVVAVLDHGPPPGALDVVLELHAQGPVVPHGVDAAVDLGRGEDEAAALGQRDDGLEVGDGGRDGVGIGGGVGHEGAPRARGLGRDTGGRWLDGTRAILADGRCAPRRPSARLEAVAQRRTRWR